MMSSHHRVIVLIRLFAARRLVSGNVAPLTIVRSYSMILFIGTNAGRASATGENSTLSICSSTDEGQEESCLRKSLRKRFLIA